MSNPLRPAAARESVLVHLRAHAAAARALEEQVDLIVSLADVFTRSLVQGGKILFFGNGGSAADAQHLAAEFVVRFTRQRRALPALALTVDTSVLTAGGNDFGFEEVFARQVEALARAGDVVVGISTSGNSPNVLRGIAVAANLGCVTVGFTGGSGGRLAGEVTHEFRAPSPVTARVQECHLLVGHIVCDLVEERFTETGGPGNKH